MTAKLAFALALLFAAVPCAAQQAGAPARELTTAAPIKMPAATSPAADLFFFVGAAGARQRFTVTSKTPVEITLFGPGGDVMLSKEGSGTVTLTAVLSWVDVHTVAVTRANAATPYTIAMSANEPTLHDASFASFVGEQQIDRPGGATFTQCWEIPGERIRVVESGEIVMLSRSGVFETSISERNGVVTTQEGARRFDDKEVVVKTRTRPGGAVSERREPFDPSVFQRPANLKYAGYYCPGYAPRG
jgi:hypothetical protein